MHMGGRRRAAPGLYSGRMPAFLKRNLHFIAALEALVIIVLLAVLIEPYLVVRVDTEAVMSSMSPAMMQKEFNLTANDPVPTISYTLTKDVIGGYDLHVVTTNFTFTPEALNTAPVADQGHVHLYIDGRLYLLLAPWYHIDSIAPGTHSIIVSLNANDHSVFAEAGQPVEATSTFDAPAIQ